MDIKFYIRLMIVFFPFPIELLGQINLSPMWGHGKYWKPQTYAPDHGGIGLYYAVDFYNTKYNRADLYFNGAEDYILENVDEPIYAAQYGIASIELTRMTDTGGNWTPYDGINIPHHCFSLHNGTIKIDMAVKITNNDFRTIYAHLEIDSRFFSSSVIQAIKNKITYFQQGGTSAQSVPTLISVNTGNALGTINKWGLAQNYHLHFQVLDASGKVDLSDPNKVKIEGQTIFDLSLQDNNYKFPAMKRTKYSAGNQVIVSSSWEGLGAVNVRYTCGGTVIDSVRDGMTGFILEGPSVGILNSRYHLWYKVNFGLVQGWIAAEYIDPYSVGSSSLILTSSLQISPASTTYNIGQQISGTFTISNKGNSTITFAKLLIGGRLNDNNTVRDFPSVTNITLNANQSYTYQANFTLSESGNYKFFPAYQTVDGTWKTSLYNEIPTDPGITSLVNITVTTSPQQFSISGRVVDENSKGIDAVTITLTIDKNSTVLTNSEGYYTIDNINSGGIYEVTPSKDGYNFTPASYKYVEQRQNQKADFVGTQKLNNITCGASPQSGGVTQGSGYFPVGKIITLSAKPNDGWSFVNWTQNGVQQNTDVNYTFTVYDNRNLIANFRQIPQYYTINCTSNLLEGGNTSGCDTYLKNTQINLHAIANAGYQFTNWTENGNVESTNPFYSFNIDRNRNLVANFSLIPYGETITKPNQPFGQSIGVVNKSYEFYLGGAISNYSDKVQYYVDWGDGSNSGWLPIGTTILQHSWNSPGIYNIKDQARCATHTNIISEWSTAWAMNVTAPNSNWTVKHNGGSDLRSAFFIDANNGWVVGVQSIILHTIDSGNTWISQNSPVSFCSFYSVYFTDQNNGWICGSNNNTLGGIIIHTTDGGNNWTIQYNDSGSPNVVRWITAMNNNELFAAWDNGFLYTYDNGNTWQSKIISPLSKIRKGTGNDIWATTMDGKIIYSNNFGNDWITKYTPPGGNNILDIASYGSNVWGVGALPYFKIIYSSNGGNSWQEQSSGGVPVLRSVYFLDENSGWAVGGAIISTKNGGQIWNVSTNPTQNFLFDVFYSSGIVWAVGDQGTILKFVDTTSVQITINSVPVSRQITVDGTNFTSPATFTWNKNSMHTISASSQQNEGSDKRFIWNNWSDGATISHTITASSNLTYTASFTTQYYVTAQSSNGGTINLQSNWFNEGQSVSFQATPNYGYKFVNWTENGKEVSQNEIYTFTVSKSRTLLANFALADYKVILNVEPSNGGVPDGYGVYHNGQVVTISAVPNSEFNFVNWTESGNIVQTNSSFPVTITNDRTLVANFSVKPSLVVKPGVLELNETSGTSQLTVSNSRAGTMNWSAVADSNWLYITSGNSGTNSGVINLGYQANLSSAMREETITVTSTGSIGSPMIIKVRQRGAVTEVENETKLPKSFMLYQNYPNPFNPTTTIKFSIPSLGRNGISTYKVVLKVYDLLGREVATLVNEEKAPGNYEVKFDGTNLASGVYFYSLHAGDYYATKKLTLVK